MYDSDPSCALLRIRVALHKRCASVVHACLAAMTSGSGTFEGDLPVVSSLAECVQLYWGSLTTKQRCGLRMRAGSIWRVGTACSGADSVVKALEHLGRSCGWAFTHEFSCECDVDTRRRVQGAGELPKGARDLP